MELFTNSEILYSLQVPNLKTLGNVARMKLWIDDTSETDIYPHLEAVSDQVG